MKKLLLTLFLLLFTSIGYAEYTYDISPGLLDYYQPQTPWASDINATYHNITYLRFLNMTEPAASGVNWASFQLPALAANIVFTLPADDGEAGQVLTTDGYGNLTFGSGAAPGGNVTNGGLAIDQVPYASSESEIKGDAQLTYNATTNILTTDNLTVTGTATLPNFFTQTQTLALANLTNYYTKTVTDTNFFNKSVDTIALTDNTTGNYVASVATTAPLTGGAAGSEGATLTLTLTQLGDVVATAPLLVNGTTNVDNILPGVDADTTFSLNMLGDLATTSPIIGAVANIFPGTNGNKATIAFNNGALALKNQTKSISIYNITASHDVLLWKTPKAITITQVDMACTGGTDVVAVLQECNVTGQACVNINTTFWQTLANQGTSVDDFNDAAIAAGAWIALNTTTVNGTPPNWALTTKFDE